MDSTDEGKMYKTAVVFLEITANNAGQRLDNYLMGELKQLPKSRIYRLMRKGEVRVNKKRVKPAQKLLLGDVVRIPPIEYSESATPQTQPAPPSGQLNKVVNSILYEDEALIVLNKPSGLPVHGGSSHPYGIIELFRVARPDLSFIELVHRLDKETSGLLLLAKSRDRLLALHTLIQQGQLDKHYYVLVAGDWPYGKHQEISQLSYSSKNGRHGGAKVSVTDEGEGKEAESIFTPVEHLGDYTLLSVQILTGRMHQIRTQLAHLGHPVMGDDRYGDFAKNRQLQQQVGLKRLFLHAYLLNFRLTEHSDVHHFKADLADELGTVLKGLRKL